MACEISLFLWVTLPCATYINSLRFCFLVQGVALSEWEMTPFGPWVLAVATFASMELFPVVFLPTSPMWVAAMALGRLWNWIPVIYSWGCCGHAAH